MLVSTEYPPSVTILASALALYQVNDYERKRPYRRDTNASSLISPTGWKHCKTLHASPKGNACLCPFSNRRLGPSQNCIVEGIRYRDRLERMLQLLWNSDKLTYNSKCQTPNKEKLLGVKESPFLTQALWKISRLNQRRHWRDLVPWRQSDGKPDLFDELFLGFLRFWISFFIFCSLQCLV